MFARELMEKRPRLGSSKRKLLLGLAGSTCLLVAACAGTASLAGVGGDVAVAARSAPVAAPVSATPTLALTLAPTLAPTASPSPSPSLSPSPSMTPTPTPISVQQAVTLGKLPAQLGPNSLSIPALNIAAAIGTSSCGGLIPDGIWRWPCAGANNLYLLGHAWGVFAPIHDGYHSGALTVGMVAIYRDGAGAFHQYKLQWVEDLTVSEWGKGAAWAATSGPVITLQTCDGAASDYRIIVRFVPA